MQLTVHKFNEASALHEVNLDDKVFNKPFRRSLVHQVVVASMAKKRQGTHQQKTRAMVSGGGAKPWRQKGTGRARAGTTRSPLWRKGGVVFAAVPRDYSQKVNKKMYKVAVAEIYAELIRQERLKVVDTVLADSHKTKHFQLNINHFHDNTKLLLIIVDSIDTNLHLASRNIPNVKVVLHTQVDITDLIKSDKVLITEKSLFAVQESLT